MKYIDEFRDGERAQALAAAIAPRGVAGAPLPPHGVLRRPHARHLALRPGRPAAAQRAHDPRARLPGLRAADRAASTTRSSSRSGPGLILCTYARHACACPARKGRSLLKAKARGRRHPHGVFDRRRAAHRARASGPRGGVLRHRLRDHHAADGAWRSARRTREGLANFSVFCNHVLTPAAISNILESPEVRELGTVPLDGFVGPAHVSTVIGSQPYEFFAEEYRQPGGDRRLRAARRDAGDPDAGAPAQRGPRRGRERVHPRGHPRRQRQGEGAGRRGVRAAPHVRMARPGRGALQRAAHQASTTRAFDAETPLRHRATSRCPTTRPASAARSCAA